MAADEVGRVSDPPTEHAAGERAGQRRALLFAVAIAALIALWFFPLFHVVPLRTGAATAAADAARPAFDPAAFAEKFWREGLAPAASRATAAPIVISALRRDPGAAAKQHAHHVGIGGTAYYFVRGAGRVASVGKNEIVVAVDGAGGAQVALRTGPLFGNTVRDGTGLLNVNEFPGLAEFNALSAAINRLVETRVLPPLRERAVVGATLEFAGCTEVPDAIGAGPVLSLTACTSRWRAREMASASTRVVSRMAMILSTSAWTSNAFEVMYSTKSSVGLAGPPRPPTA